MQDWQRELPIHKESVLATTKQSKMLFVSKAFVHKETRMGSYECQVKVWVEWSSKYNAINKLSFYRKVISCSTGQESEYVSWCDVPDRILDAIPASILALEKWNGCSTAGPWYYIENTVHHASDRDCWNMQKGQYKQILFGGQKDQPCWDLVAISPEGLEMPVHQVTYNSSCHGPKPTGDWRLEWRPSWKIGEGKEREFEYARNEAIWPEATCDDLTDPNLAARLKERLPGLLVEFRKVVEGFGFTW